MGITSTQRVKSLAAANRKPNPVGGTNKDIVKRVTFRPASNGFVSETHKGDEYGTPETTVHSSISHAAGHLKKQFALGDDKG